MCVNKWTNDKKKKEKKYTAVNKLRGILSDWAVSKHLSPKILRVCYLIIYMWLAFRNSEKCMKHTLLHEICSDYVKKKYVLFILFSTQKFFSFSSVLFLVWQCFWHTVGSTYFHAHIFIFHSVCILSTVPNNILFALIIDKRNT